MYTSRNDQSKLNASFSRSRGHQIVRMLEMCYNISITLQGIYDYELNRNLMYDEELVVPIIENTLFEKDLEESMAQALRDYPGTSAILVRRHGVYVWGQNWQKAKTM